MIYAMNYADGQPFEKFRRYNTWTAKKRGGVKRVFEFSSKDIDSSFRSLHRKIFAYNRGAGLWLWKPYLIRKALLMIKENDWLFYADSGSIYINRVEKLVEIAERDNMEILLFELPLLNREFTKRESYVAMGVEDNGENQALATFVLIKRNSHAMLFVDEWLKYCTRENIISPNCFNKSIYNYNGFVAHREDQSILSLLKIIYSLPSYRDPSDYGEMPFMYKLQRGTYNPKEYKNSPYPTIVLCNRKVHPLIYFAKYVFKHALCKIGYYKR